MFTTETRPPSNVMNIRPRTWEYLPPSFKVLSGKNIQNYYQKVIDDWKPITDVWSIRIAPYITHVLIAGSALYINLRYRKTLKLRSEGLAFSIAATSLSATILFGGADGILRGSVLENDYNPLLTQWKYAGLYVGCGVFHPLVLSPITNLYIGLKYNLRTPDLTEVRKIANVCLTTVKPVRFVLFGLGLSYSLWGAFIGHETMKSVYLVHSVIADLHRNYLESYEKIRLQKEELEIS